METLDIGRLISEPGGPVLVDCMTLWLTRLMDGWNCWSEEGWAQGADGLRTEVADVVDTIGLASRDLVLVTNEVGQGVVAAEPGTRRFVDAMGALNTALGGVVDDVVWCVAGRQVRL